MKKTLLITCCIAVISTSPLVAQDIGFGVKGGINFANQMFVPEQWSLSPDGRTGFHAGIFVPVMFSDKFGIQSELLYSTKGSRFELEIDFSDDLDQYKVNLTYIDIPILFRYQPLEILSLHAGPQLSLLTSAEFEIKSKGFSRVLDSKERYKDIDLGWAVGAQLELPIGFITGARYSLSLLDINGPYDDNDTAVLNRTLQFFAGWKFLR